LKASVLVANRGEIAGRVIRSCRLLGLKSVAVYSEADKDLSYVTEADTAIAIGPGPASQSYLKIDTIIKAAQSSGCDAIHPGYGFLSENAEFAQAVMDTGICWIGPRPDTIKAMGDKNQARIIAAKAGVPIIPGSERFETGSIKNISNAAQTIGFPLLVKASAGGGGIGMKRVDTLEQLVPIAEATQSMALRTFGDGSIFLEKFIPWARHIEIQVFGFGNGLSVHMYERDCSIQRRFQKIIEESPAPGLDATVQKKMADAAMNLCRVTNYSGAGTVEFILNTEAQTFYFLELNTRIQVEHPVTELVTGLDLVGMQIQHAFGNLETLDQEMISTTGHAIECRLYAENPEKSFLPSPGTLRRFRLPTNSHYVRIDTGYCEGDTIPHYYDPMIAKLIFNGTTREIARQKAIEALKGMEIDGVYTNLNFLIACLEHTDFIAENVHTNFVNLHIKELVNI
jgi:3-methylcrotonyl-CoA carboxylase alpha subunit